MVSINSRQPKLTVLIISLSQGGQDVADAQARATEDKRVTRNSRGSNPSGGTAEVPLDAIPPLSLGESCWQRAASEIFADNMEVD
ncbi:hypothetical protein KEM48_011931 [Puccinia striiformis f. sp. tritici PST-130]|nr:hypothetical protein KEM48_011931 [Puccinia striiformis f. sp. tritici PST-130]